MTEPSKTDVAPKRLRVWIEQAGVDWDVKAELDEVVIYEESHLDEFAARDDAERFERQLLSDLGCAADATLAWQRVTELQERCTELVLERRATAERADRAEAERDAIMCASNNHAARVQESAAKLGEFVRQVREWNRVHGGTAVRWPGLEGIVAKYEAKP